MSNDDVLYGYRLRLFALAAEIGVRSACRALGMHHSTYYRWKRRVDRWGLEALRVRERRWPRMPNQLGPHLEQRILAFSLAHPGFGPKRMAAELAREKWGGLRISANGVYRVLYRHGLNTRSRRLALVAGYAARYERVPPQPEPERHVEASRPGELVGIDCFYIGRLSGTKGAVWQYTAIDVASGFAWAELHATPKHPAARHCSALVARVASELAQAGSAAGSGHHRQRLRVSRAHFHRHACPARRPAATDPGRQTDLERARGAAAADDPRGVLAAGLRPLACAQADGARARPRALPRLLRFRPRSQRPPDPRTGPQARSSTVRGRVRCCR
jgi:transposase